MRCPSGGPNPRYPPPMGTGPPGGSAPQRPAWQPRVELFAASRPRPPLQDAVDRILHHGFYGSVVISQLVRLAHRLYHGMGPAAAVLGMAVL